AVNYTLTLRNLINRIDENRTLGLKFFDDEAVVHDLFADVYWRPEGFQRNTHDIDGTNHLCAESARLQQKQAFLVFRHVSSFTLKDTLSPGVGCTKANRNDNSGQRKSMNREQLAANCKNQKPNGYQIRITP